MDLEAGQPQWEWDTTPAYQTPEAGCLRGEWTPHQAGYTRWPQEEEPFSLGPGSRTTSREARHQDSVSDSGNGAQCMFPVIQQLLPPL